MSSKNVFLKFFQGNQPKGASGRRVVGERGSNDLPPGKKGGETMTPDRHYEHKQHAFDSFCKKVLKCEAYNGYREISRRQSREVAFSELPEDSMEQLASYDRYPWEYTSFPVGGDVILIEDDRLAEALNALPQDGRDHPPDVLLPGHGRPRDRQAYEHGTPDGQRPQAESLSAAKGADGR